MEDGPDDWAGPYQIGEFSYVLVQVARDARVVGDDVYNAISAASMITILLHGLLMRYALAEPKANAVEEHAP